MNDQEADKAKWLASNLMGWRGVSLDGIETYTQERPEKPSFIIRYRCVWVAEYVRLSEKTLLYSVTYSPWNPFTSIADAWEVLEAVTTPRARYIQWPGQPEGVQITSATVFANLFMGANIWAESASEAATHICELALRAWGYYDDNQQSAI